MPLPPGFTEEVSSDGPPAGFLVDDDAEMAEPGKKIGMLDTILPAIGFATESLPQNRLRSVTLDPLGEKTAEVGGRAGFPVAGAALGTAIQIAPELLSTGLGLRGLYRSQSPVAKGLLNTTEELGPQYEAQNEAIGVVRRVPREGGAVPKFAPPERIAATKQPTPVVPAEPLPSNVPARYPSKPGDFLAYANGRWANAPKNIAPQELMDWQVKLQTDMSSGAIPKIDPNTGRITTIYQQATDLLSRTKKYFSDVAEPALKGARLPKGTIPTRSGLNKAYGVSAKQEAVTRGLKNVGKKVGKIGLLAALGYGGLRGLFQ